MLNHIQLSKVLCLDIETVPQYPSLNQTPEEVKQLWNRKAEFLKRKENDDDTTLYQRAGIYAEFGRIVCISAGQYSKKEGLRKMKILSFFGDDEKELLQEFSQFLEKCGEVVLCAHNGKEFDFPYLSRRMLINGLPLPEALKLSGKKPWEINHLDTLELWKFGDYKHYTPLNLLAYIFSIPSPKDDIDGSQVYSIYWQDHDLARIERYCKKDVLTVMQILLRMKGEPILMEEEVAFE